MESILTVGKREQSDRAMILLHGRGADARDILGLVRIFEYESLFAMAPDAPGHQWYPQPFTQPLEENQPYLDQALETVDQLLKDLLNDFDPEQLYLLGFSQGACLAGEYLARNPKKLGGLIMLSGGLIGEDQDLEVHHGDLEKTRVYLGCSQEDPYISFDRVEQTIEVFNRLNADIKTNFYPQASHQVTPTDVANLHGFVH